MTPIQYTGALIEDGIHFGLPFETYLADPALGSSSIKAIVLDPVEYQYSRLHGSEKEETWALKWGHAIHCRALEGRDEFYKRFVRMPAKADYTGLLDTMDDFRAYAKGAGIKVGKSKAEAVENVRMLSSAIPIWEDILADFGRRTEGLTALPGDAFEEIERAVAWMQRDRYLSDVMDDGTLVAGASEVSIFYTDNGVRLKCRIDHLMSNAALDLKSFRPFFSEPIAKAAKKAIERMRYDIQAADYMRALKAGVALHKAGKVFNDPYDPDFLGSVFASVASDDFKWIWILIKASGAPQPVVREFALESTIYTEAQASVEKAIADYRSYREEFGVDDYWAPRIPIEVLSDEDFSPMAFTR